MRNKTFETHILQPDDLTHAKDIFNIMNENLLTPEEFYKLDTSKKNYFSKNGFVIGYHTPQKIKKWIENNSNHIYVVKNIEKPENPIVGYCIILSTEDIIKKIQQYSTEMIFKDHFSYDIILSGNFKYLIQIAFLKDYKNMGLGSKLLHEIFNEIKVPLISYVIKSPILNQISLYTHLKLGFTYMGLYKGRYSETKDTEFKNYQSIGLIHRANSKLIQSHAEILKIMSEIIYASFIYLFLDKGF
ncbi:MAG: GNAT family N-acetyltransferase [Candidatus Lokiarchaeota archaeon]|nr:GNAT family N-acetyltransferase [Candidatus Lokiarchaeota archaeon]